MMDVTYQSLSDGRYKLVSELGEGGMATVWRAYDERLRIDRAIKILAPHLVRNETIRKRFENEALTMARLHHPNIVTVHDVVLDGDTVFIVMELVAGGSLLDALQRHGLFPASQAAAVVRAVLNALTVAHGAGVIHRDIKPHNVLLDRHGTPKLSDFGIAQVMDNKQLTRTGSTMGTIGFMAPEQQDDARGVDVRADIYAVGATLYALVTGRNPVNLFAHDRDPAIMAGVPPMLAPVIARACSYTPDDRYPDAVAMSRALGEALGEALSNEPTSFADLVPPSLREAPSHSGESRGSNLTMVPKHLEPVEPPASPITASETWAGPAETLHEGGGVGDAGDAGDAGSVGDTAIPGYTESDEAAARSRTWVAVIPIALLLLGVGGGWYLSGQPDAPIDAPTTAAAPTEGAVAPVAEDAVADVAEPEGADDEAEESTEGAAAGGVEAAGDDRAEAAEAPQLTADPIADPIEGSAVGGATEPAVSEEPEEPEAAEEPTSTSVSVALVGDASEAWLVGPGINTPLPASVPPGAYEIRASFGGELRGAGAVTVPAEGSLTINCISAFRQCKLQ